MYRVGAFGEEKPLVSLLTQPGFLPRDVTAVFTGIPVDVVESLQRGFAEKQNRELVWTPDEPRYMLLYNRRPDIIAQCKKYVHD